MFYIQSAVGEVNLWRGIFAAIRKAGRQILYGKE